MSTHTPPTADAFVRKHGWNTPTPAIRARMNRALAYFYDAFGENHLNRIVAEPSPFASQGQATKLVEYMQSIDFEQDVDVIQLERGTKLLAFKLPGRSGMGEYFTDDGGNDEDAQRQSLAIPKDQTEPRHYVVEKTLPKVLASRVATAFISLGWLRYIEGGHVPKDKLATEGFSDKYRRGGGRQYIIPRGVALSHLATTE